MNTIVQNQLDQLENSLNTLIDSIASYNPSILAATDLVNADDDLNKGISQRKSYTYISEDQKLILKVYSNYSSSQPCPNTPPPQHHRKSQPDHLVESDSSR